MHAVQLRPLREPPRGVQIGLPGVVVVDLRGE